MPGKNETILLEQMANELFQMQTLGAAARSRSRKKGAADLTETEFLTLELLSKHDNLTVGEIQKQIGVLPAQMSRVVRSLEKRSDGALIKCRINRIDKRKVDVEITKPGKLLHKNYKQVRLVVLMNVLKHLSNKDCKEFMRICRALRSQLESAPMR